ncbi:MAG: hypothetical protein GEU90_19495 [Gemmatimonas sp.]|nr:hypothetical protein [Gemmatimonas sp.]
MADQERGERSSLEGDRAAEERHRAGREAVGRTGEPAEGVMTLICFKCGTEYYFEDRGPPPEMSCEKCGNTVFRPFFTAEGDEAADDFEESTHRDLDPDDAEGEALPGDVRDLDPG